MSETVGAAAAAKQRRLKTIGAANDKKSRGEAARRFTMGNNEVVKKINVPSKPKAGGYPAAGKPEYEEDSRRKGRLPKVDNNVLGAVENPGAAINSGIKQSRDSSRRFWKPAN